MSFISVLDSIGTVISDIFKVAVPVATDLEPIFDAFFPAWADIYNETLQLDRQRGDGLWCGTSKEGWSGQDGPGCGSTSSADRV